MDNAEFFAAICFLSDIFHHLNQLNMELQDRDKTVMEFVERFHAFQRKLPLFFFSCWSMSRQNAPLPHIPHKSGLQITEVMTGFIDALKPTLPLGLIISVSPLKWWDLRRTVSVWMLRESLCWKQRSWYLLMPLQLKLIDIKSSHDLWQSFQLTGSENSWTYEVCHEKYPHSRGLSLFTLTMG